jgi:hypothetical protein
VSFLGNGSIVQFDISTYSQAAIQSSLYVVYSSSTGFRSLKLGPNGKLYAARTTLTSGGNGSSYIAVINNPNLAGAACNFVNDGVFIGMNRGRWGLNNVIEEFFTCNNFNFTLGPDINKCPGTSVTLAAPPNLGTYLWSNSATTQSITVSDAGTYVVTATDPNGCFGRDTVLVTVFADAVPDLGNDVTICSNQQATLNPGNFNSYEWSPNGETTATINAVDADTYSVTVTDANNCTASFTLTVPSFTALKENVASNSVSVYPNPTNGILSVKIDNLQLNNATIKVINLSGQTVYANTLRTFANATTSIDLSNQSNGVYFVQIVSDKQVITKRVIKAKN